MKRYLLVFIAAFFLSSIGMGQILYEDFNYTVPGYIGGNGLAGTSSNNWTTHSVTGTQTTTIDLLSTSLSYTGLSASSGNRVYLWSNANSTSRDVNRAITTTATTLYYSALIKIVDNVQIPTGSYDYFMHFGSTSGTTVTIFGGRLGITKVNAGANFRLAIQNTSGGTPTYTEVASDLTFGTTYLVVVKVDRSTSPISASLWVNPSSLGGGEPGGSVTNSSGTGGFTDFKSICLRNSSTTPKAEIDEIRVGTSFADVTPSGTISAPTTQTSAFTFSNVLQTQMNVSWTSGNGGKRVVKMNTTNSFTDPANGTDPTANTVYGSGEQVIYNGTGSTVPIVTGLTSATEYWFKAWEYNGSGTSTVYCTLAGTNNPLNQTSAANSTAPLISSPTVTAITATGATLGGDITADGGEVITERGTVWSLTTPVTIADNKIAEGTAATGVFTHVRTGMPNNTLIHFAAYATNSVGTTLTAESTFTTLFGEPTNHAATFAATAPTYSSVTLTWADNDGTQPATGFILMGNTTGTFTDPVDGSQPTSDPNLSDGSAFVYVSHGAQTYTFTGLTSSTHYYFAIYAYTNILTNIDYKTSPAAPAADVTTGVFVQPIAAWTFESTPANPNTPTSDIANYGVQAGTAAMYADGTNGASSWVPAELTAFGGTTTNDPREGAAVAATMAYCPQGGTANSANGKGIVFKFSMSALQDPVLTYATKYSSTSGFTSHLWSWSTDGTNFTSFGSNTGPASTTFVTKTVDMTAINALDGAATVYLKVTLDGANGSTTNNRIDNVVINASAATTLAPTVVTTAATNVAETTATVNGTVNANNQSTTVSFEYGTTSGVYGAPVAAVPPTVTGGTTNTVYADLTGLSQKTLYYYRISATNGSGTSKGAELTFETGCLATGDAGQISGPATVVADGTTQYIYTVPAIDNATNYIWSFPQPSEIFAGDGTNTVTVIFFPSAVSGDASVFATNACDLEGGSSTYAITVSDVPENRTVTGSVGASVTNCYDATNTITVAGGITTFEVLSGGSASFKAGVKISYLPGTTVWAGGYMHGQILPTGPWCSAKSPLKEAGNEEKSLDIMDNTFRIYPNPTTGNFTVEQINGSVVEYATVDILGMLGKKIVASDLTGVSKKEFSIKGHPAGIYFVRITAGEKVQTVKIILTN